MFRAIAKSKFTYWLTFVYLVALAWWVYLQFTGAASAYNFYAYYSVIGLSAGIYGFWLAYKEWGGFQSVIGRGLIFISIGLLSQWLGLLAWTYYNIVAKIEVPYPSLADIGFFGLIPAYTAAAVMFAKASGARFTLRTVRGKVYTVLFPLCALTVAYGLFLSKVDVSTAEPVKTFLDLGYPLGEIIPVTIALLTATLSWKILGGIMRSRILFLIFAFFFQFLTEYTFIYLVAAELFKDGGLDSLLYPTSYFIMGLALIAFSRSGLKVSSDSESSTEKAV